MLQTSNEMFGRYELLGRIAIGGMAEILLGALRSHEGFEKKVVIKRILPHLNQDSGFVKMFIDEAVLAAKISHPNVVAIFDFGNVDGVYFIAMEYVEGTDLRHVLKNQKDHRLRAADAAALGEQLARALSHAHNIKGADNRPLNMVHRDVNPHNVLLARTGEVKLADFGIAKAEARLSKTATGAIKGKVAYLSPEQAQGKSADKRSDQFALGLVLWEALSGRRMFQGKSDPEVVHKIASGSVLDLQSVCPEVPKALAQIVMRSLESDPSDRYADLVDMVADLAAFRFSLGSQGVADFEKIVAAVASTPEGVIQQTRVLGTGWSVESLASTQSLTPEYKAISKAQKRLAVTEQNPAPEAPMPSPQSSVALNKKLWLWIMLGLSVTSVALGFVLNIVR